MRVNSHFFDSNSNVTISDTLVSDTGGGGILFGSDNSAVRIANTNLTDTGILSDGIAFLDGNRT